MTLVDDVLRALARAGDACVLWPGYIDEDGYGNTRNPGGSGNRMAHRVVYERAVGPIPDGMTLDHQCYVTSCVNPRHVVPASRVENAKRQRSAAKTHCKRGHEFTPENTMQLPYRRGSGSRRCRACARMADAAHRARKAIQKGVAA